MSNLTSPTSTLTDSAKGSRFGYAAALWSLIFAALHVAWALGWYVGLDQESARQAFQRRWFLVYDLIAAALCVVAFAVALLWFCLGAILFALASARAEDS